MHTALCNVLCVCLYTGGGEIIANITKSNMQRERKEEKEKKRVGALHSKKERGVGTYGNSGCNRTIAPEREQRLQIFVLYMISTV